MQRSGYVLFALAACLASTQALPTESHSLPEPPSSADQHTSPESNLYPYTQPEQYAEYTQPQSSTDDDSSSSWWGIASLEALADRATQLLAPVTQLFQQTVENRTIGEVVTSARNATVNLATRVTNTDVYQGAKEVISPLGDMLRRVRDSVKDKTLSQLADEVREGIQRLDRRAAAAIASLGADAEQAGQLAGQLAEAVVEPEATPEAAPAVDAEYRK